MKPRRYYELLGRLMEGELSESDALELSAGLRTNPTMLQDLSQHLVLWEVWSQHQAPERSAASFLEAWKTRLRAESEAPEAFSKALRKRLQPLVAIENWVQALWAMIRRPARFAWAACSLLLGLSMLYWLASPRSAQAMTTIHGEAVCTSCVLHESAEHRPAIRVVDGKASQMYYLDRNSAVNGLQDYFCAGPKPVVARGKTKTAKGRLLFDAATVTIPDAGKSKTPPTNDVRTIFPI